MPENNTKKVEHIETIQVETREVRLDYGELTAVDNLSLQIPAGEIYGLVGPNGAGKSSLLKMLANLIRPTYGQLFVGGIDMAENPREAYQHIGYMPDLSPVAPELKVWEFLEYFAASYGIPAAMRKARVDHCLEQVQMTEHRDAYGKGLSRGMTQRVVLAKTLIPNPKVLLLDEPASGMDPIARINLKKILVELRSQGVTTVISSHILTELADMCTSVGIMHKGKLLKSGAINSILHDRPVSRLHLAVLTEEVNLMPILESNTMITSIEKVEEALILSFTGGLEDEAELLRSLVLADIRVTSYSKMAATMEDTLIALVSPDETASANSEAKKHNSVDTLEVATHD